MRIAGLCLTMGLLALSPATAVAAVTVRVDDTNGLLIEVFSGDSNIHVAPTSDNRLKVTETGNRSIQAGPGCTQGQPFSGGMEFVLCPRPQLAFVTFRGVAGSDHLILAPGVGDCQCNGLGGNDEIRGSDGADLIIGSQGNDVLRGGEGGDVLRGQNNNDTLLGEGGNDTLEGGTEDDTLDGGDGTDSLKGEDGADVLTTGSLPDGGDTLDGGFGIDRADYSRRRGAVSASIDGSTNDGAVPQFGQLFGERDFINGNVENLTGGNGGDTLTGGSQVNRLIGGGGNDTIRGGAPNDTSGSALTLPDDYLEGGLGADVLRGEGGADTLNARDAVDDQVDAVLSCGTGPGSVGSENDRLDADVRDDDTRALPADCESADQGMVGEDPNVHIRSANRARGEGLVVKLRCPRKARTGCEGNLAAKRLGRASAREGGFGERVKYAIERGKRTKVTVPSKARAGAFVRIRSVEEGRLGPRTTLRSLEVK